MMQPFHSQSRERNLKWRRGNNKCNMYYFMVLYAYWQPVESDRRTAKTAGWWQIYAVTLSYSTCGKQAVLLIMQPLSRCH